MRALQLLTLILLLAATPAFALDVVVGSAKVARDADAAQIVALDVWLALAPAETAPDLAAFQVAVNASEAIPGGGLLPPASPPSGAHPIVISSNFTPDFAGGDDGQHLSAAAFLDAGSTPVVDGAGLMRIELLVPAGVAGLYTLSVDLDPIQGTVLADGVGNPVAFTAVDGSVEIVQGTPGLQAPWIAGLALALIGLSRRVLSVRAHR